jgi:hypothetical protein
MLAQRLGLSINSTRPLGKWSPDDEATLVAWYQNAVGITLNGSDVSAWTDSSSNSYDMVQATAGHQPAYSGGVLTFVRADDNNLQTTGQISIAGDFTVGIKSSPTVAAAGTFLGDNDTSNELFKYNSATRIKVRIDSANVNLDLDSGTFGDDYLVITRVSNVLTLWKNGVAQTGTTPTAAGTADIDTIGARATDADTLDGTIEEIQIYSSSSADLTANINDRLAGL